MPSAASKFNKNLTPSAACAFLSLHAEGYEADTAYSAEEALARDLAAYDLVMLDIMMGEISGTQLARIMRANPTTARVPIIFCTARDAVEDVVKGLDLGADDYIVKPYALGAVLARVRAVLRRTAAGADKAAGGPVAYKGLSLSAERKVCIVDGREVRMPKKEFEILLRLLTERGRIFSRDELIREIWPNEVVVLDRVVDVNITRIRQKLGDYGKHIVTRSGYGYGFVE